MLGLARRWRILILALAFLPAAAAPAPSAPRQDPSGPGSPARVLLQPRFKPGQVTRYHLTLESDSTTGQSGSISDPQGPSSLGVTWDATIRLEVSAAANASTGGAAAGPLLLRMTYESSQATVRSDAPDPRADGIRRQYAQLAGRSLEFTLTSAGQVSEIRGLEGFVDDQQARAAARQWIEQLSAGAALPAGGVEPGQKWESTQAAELPLAGLSWRTDATYLRNEPCRLVAAPEAGTAPASSPDRADCAVILSRLALITTHPLRDPTPDEYRQRGLHTSGRWTGSGQSLTYVSLDTGWAVSSTQESTEEMDVTIAGAPPDAPNAVRHSGTVITRSQVSLLNDAAR
jgi:hypothetical protein